jgi:leader peptidase (prepilin peptidase)/N-methyltransferase
LIRWYENIPMLSYVFFVALSVQLAVYHRFPVSTDGEAVTGGLFFFYCLALGGWTVTALVWCGFSAALLALAIDWDTTLLPTTSRIAGGTDDGSTAVESGR